jgi:hypothetical protein
MSASIPQQDTLPPGQDHPVQITLDGKEVTSPSRRRTGLQIRQLGDPNRVTGFETQRIDCKSGKKEKTIRDDEVVELHPKECFRTVPNAGGPGAAH